MQGQSKGVAYIKHIYIHMPIINLMGVCEVAKWHIFQRTPVLLLIFFVTCMTSLFLFIYIGICFYTQTNSVCLSNNSLIYLILCLIFFC